MFRLFFSFFFIYLVLFRNNIVKLKLNGNSMDREKGTVVFSTVPNKIRHRRFETAASEFPCEQIEETASNRVNNGAMGSVIRCPAIDPDSQHPTFSFVAFL